MGFLDEHDPEPESGEEQLRPPGKILRFPPRARPGWLTGPTDDVRAADEGGGTPALPGEGPVLTRPDAQAPRMVEAEREEPVAEDAAEAEPAAPASWAPAASSVPVLRMPLPAEPEVLEEEQDEAEPPSAVPVPPRGLPDGDEDRQVVPLAPALAPLEEPWWLVALDALRSDWRVQAGVGGGILALFALGIVLWPHGVDSTYLRDLRHDPARFDGQTILVRGRVGDDVYPVGSGWAFYLTQGRDTIVAFTRTRAPRAHEVVSVRGQVSTGFLDGQPRQALFEDPAPPK